jgi:hypothetical protein
MFDPDRIVFSSRLLMVIRHEKTDRSGPAPLNEVLNPLRYSVTLWPGTTKWRTIINSRYRSEVSHEH